MIASFSGEVISAGFTSFTSCTGGHIPDAVAFMFESNRTPPGEYVVPLNPVYDEPPPPVDGGIVDGAVGEK